MNKNRKLKQRVAASVAVGIASVVGIMQITNVPVYAAQTGQTEKTGSIYKEETVYVNADASGNETQITVSDWLKNVGNNGSVQDESALENIKNVKGDETFTSQGDSLTWDTEGEDIYYQGTTRQELPVSIKLTWYLDGKEISPDELTGKSGQMEVKIDYENLAKRTVSVDGKKEEVYTPFVMMTGLILPGENCSNVAIDNGRVISDGDRNIVVGFAMPGMKESLGLSESDVSSSGLSLPESLTISADVTDFTVPSTFTVALSDLMDNMDLDKIADAGDLENALGDLEDAALKLVGGSSELTEGADTLSEGVDSYTKGVDQLGSAIGRYLGDDGALSGKVTEYVNGVDTAVLGIKDYTKGADTLADGITNYINGENQLAGGAAELAGLKEGLEQVQTALDQLAEVTDGETDNGSGKDLKAAAQALADGTEKMENALGSDAVKKLIGQVESMTQTGQELIEQTEQLNAGMKQGIVSPVQNIAAQFQNLSGELQKMTQLQDNLEAACGRINETVNADNAKIADVKAKGETARQAVESSTASLEMRREILQESDPAAAQEIQNAIDVLRAAGDSAEVLESLEELEAVQTDQLGAAAVDAETVRQTADAINKNMNIFASTAAELSVQIPELEGKIEEIRKASDALPGSALTELSGQVEQLNEGMQKLNAAIGGSGGLSESIALLDRSAGESFPAASAGIDALNAGFERLGTYNTTLLAGAFEIKEAGKTLTAGADTLAGGTQTLSYGLDELGAQMNAGVSLLTQNSGALRDGAGALKNGAHTLEQSMRQFEEQGTSRLKTTLDDRLGDIVDRLKALNSEDAAYDTFSGKDDSMEGNVKFIIETEAGK